VVKWLLEPFRQSDQETLARCLQGAGGSMLASRLYKRGTSAMTASLGTTCAGRPHRSVW